MLILLDIWHLNSEHWTGSFIFLWGSLWIVLRWITEMINKKLFVSNHHHFPHLHASVPWIHTKLCDENYYSCVMVVTFISRNTNSLPSTLVSGVMPIDISLIKYIILPEFSVYHFVSWLKCNSRRNAKVLSFQWIFRHSLCIRIPFYYDE